NVRRGLCRMHTMRNGFLRPLALKSHSFRFGMARKNGVSDPGAGGNAYWEERGLQAASVRNVERSGIIECLPASERWSGVNAAPLFASAQLVSASPSRYTEPVIYDASLDELLQKVWDGQRIN